MAFWSLAYSCKWVTIAQLRLAVRTEGNPYGDISPVEFEQITGKEF